MRTLPLRIADQVTLDGSGNGQVELTCDVAGWTLNMAGLRVDPRPVTLEPECQIFINGQFVGGSLSASMDADTTFNQSMQQGEKIQAVWTGGDPGKTAILSLTGTKTLDP
jgi:hypothetical protein